MQRWISLALLDDHGQVSKQLERIIASSDLGLFVAELRAVAHSRGSTSTHVYASELWSGRLPQVLENGLQAVPYQYVCKLLEDPDSLLELQKVILAADSQYWNRLIRNQPPSLAANQSRRSVALQMGPEALTLLSGNDGRDARNETRWPTHRGWLVSAVIAIGIAIVCLWLRDAWKSQSYGLPDQHRWGWQLADESLSQLESPEFFYELATLHTQWYAVRPANQEQLSIRLTEFVLGCERVEKLIPASWPAEATRELNDKLALWILQAQEIIASTNTMETRLQDANRLEVEVQDYLRRKSSNATR